MRKNGIVSVEIVATKPSVPPPRMLSVVAAAGSGFDVVCPQIVMVGALARATPKIRSLPVPP
jgi:hypothetical protein